MNPSIGAISKWNIYFYWNYGVYYKCIKGEEND